MESKLLALIFLILEKGNGQFLISASEQIDIRLGVGSAPSEFSEADIPAG